MSQCHHSSEDVEYVHDISRCSAPISELLFLLLQSNIDMSDRPLKATSISNKPSLIRIVRSKGKYSNFSFGFWHPSTLLVQPSILYPSISLCRSIRCWSLCLAESIWQFIHLPTHRLTWFTHLPALHLSKLSTDISVDPTVDLTNGPPLCVSQTNLTTSYPIPSCSIPFFYLFQPRSIHTPITLFPPPLSLFALVSFLAPPALRSYPNLSHYIQSAVSIHVYPCLSYIRY